jgi:hypothetical protein
MTNKEIFSEAYRRNLERAAQSRPDQYGFIVGHVNETADRMLAAVERRTYNKDGFAFKWTCKELGIKYTYTAINNFWRS